MKAMPKSQRSAIVFLFTCALLLGLKLLFDFYPPDYTVRGQESAFAWPVVLSVIVIAALGLSADRALGLPKPFEDARRERTGFVWSTVTGVIYGLISIGGYIYSRQNHPLATSEWAHLPLPWSIPFYVYGAIFLEFLLRLGALCIVFWLLHVMIFRRRFRSGIFWIVNCFVALYEIVPYVQDYIQRGNWLGVLATPVDPLYLSNVFEGWLLLRFGWLAPIVFRISFYIVWHMLFGGLAKPYFVP
jgi:hypothetical protein